MHELALLLSGWLMGLGVGAALVLALRLDRWDTDVP